MKKIIYFVIILIFVGCGNNDTIEKATKFSIDEVKNTPGFHWFQIEYDTYSYDSAIVDSIGDCFEKDELKIIIFASPGCYCGSLYTRFPQLIKILDGANISENNYEVYVTDDTGNKLRFEHPYSNLLNVNTLPAFYLLKSDDSYYDVLLQVNTKYISIEEALLTGIKFL